MKPLITAALICLSAVAALCLLLLLFGISNTPDVAMGWTLTHNDIRRAKQILHEGSKTKPDALGTLELSQADLNLASNYLLNRYSKSAARIEIKNQVLRFNVTMTLPRNSLGQYLNISFRLGKENPDELLSLTKFKAGKLLLPAKFASFVIGALIHHTSLRDYFILESQPIKAIHIEPQKIIITYYSNLDTLIQAREFLTQPDAPTTVSIYQQALERLLAEHDPAWRLSLADLLKPLFALAYQQSTAATAIAENKKVIMTVNSYVNNRSTRAFMSAATPKPSKRYAAFLYKRIDLAQHFIASAAITASVNGQIAEAVGEEKELNDAQGGSGFSFVDLAADKAGTRLGETAIASPESARKLQKALSQIKDYSDFMPDPRDLPEHMDANQFKQRYESVNSPAYLALSKQIDQRIAALPIYQQAD
ncbi:MAG: hypothetical protein HOP34_10650 [Methylococcaceae bacterium]|nr:hypothetical protein [Methylococcaceae bacterium]